MNFYVVIYEHKAGNPVEVKRMGPMSERQAEKVECGVGVNLNHERFFTRIEAE